MKVFLVYLALDTPQNRGYNYGLGYIAAVLEKGGYNVKYLTLKNKRDVNDLYTKIKREKPSVVAFSSTSTQFRFVKQLSKEIRSFFNGFIICGGVHTTLEPECILDVPELDAIVRGEGEYPLLEFVDCIEKGSNSFKIKNFWFRNGKKIIKNEIRPLIENLDELPLPSKSSLDYQKIIDNSGGENNFIFSRGCPFECTYCSNKALSSIYPNKYKYFRQISPQKAIEEIEGDSKRYKFNSIVFDDDTISLNKKWFYDFFTLYQQKFDYPFKCNLRIGTVDSSMMALLKKAGVKQVLVGVEQGNEGFRKKVLKRYMSNKQMLDFFRICERYKVPYKAFIMVGFPFENKRLFFDTVKFCRKISVRSRAYIFQPYPGTELGHICEMNNWMPDKEDFREREEAVIGYPSFSKKEIQLCSDASYFLISFKFIPLSLPLEFTAYPFAFLNRIRNKMLSFLNKQN